MAYELNFNKKKKQHLIVTLNDENKTRLLVTIPKKAVLEQFFELQNAVGDSELDSDALDSVYSITALVLSENIGRIEITKEKVESILDFEDIQLFFKAYMEFVRDVVSAKN